MKRDCFFTSIAINYLPKALALASSVFDAYPEARFVVSLIDHRGLSDTQQTTLIGIMDDFKARGRNLIFFDPLSLYDRPDLFLFRYNVVEACTSVKPAVAAALMDTAEIVTYLDPDTILYSRFPDQDDITWEFELTPHVLAPSNPESLISERLFMFYGTFNLGYFAVRKSKQTKDFLRWWREFCFNYGADAPHAGLFVDQKPVDLLPCFVDRMHILRHPGCNVAWWNVFCDGRRVDADQRVNFQGKDWPLIFYHFSNMHRAVDPCQRTVANPLRHYVNRHGEASILLSSYPDLKKLFEDYDKRTLVPRQRWSNTIFINEPARRTAPILVRLLMSEALRRGMTYYGDPAERSHYSVGWYCWLYILRSTSGRDIKTALAAVFSMLRLTVATSLLRFTNLQR